MTTPWIVAFACLWLLVLLLAFCVIGLMRRVGAVLERAEHLVAEGLEGAAPLTVIPPFDLADEMHEVISSTTLIDSTTIVLFLESGCKPCTAIAAELATSGWSERLPLLVVAGEEGLGPEFNLPGEVPVYRQREREVAKLFKSVATPHAFLIDGAGVVLDRVIPGTIADLERMAERQRAAPRRLESVADG
jgi:hypothetical protein